MGCHVHNMGLDSKVIFIFSLLLFEIGIYIYIFGQNWRMRDFFYHRFDLMNLGRGATGLIPVIITNWVFLKAKFEI